MEFKDLKPGEFMTVASGVGRNLYYTPCVTCGGLVKTWSKRKDVKFRCTYCKAIENKENKEEIEKLTDLGKELAHLTKVKRLENSKAIIKDLYGTLEEYERPFSLIEKKLHTPGWFESINEVLVAAELLRMKVKAHHQVKVKRWRIDFVLPDVKVILEIDGKQHKDSERSQKRDVIRDKFLLAKFGPLWEIIRLPDERIRKDLKRLVPAIAQIVRERRKVRKSHNGQLPNNYSEQL